MSLAIVATHATIVAHHVLTAVTHHVAVGTHHVFAMVFVIHHALAVGVTHHGLAVVVTHHGFRVLAHHLLAVLGQGRRCHSHQAQTGGSENRAGKAI